MLKKFEFMLLVLFALISRREYSFAQDLVWETIFLESNSDFNCIWFTDDNKGWICGDSGSIYHTEDGGLTWNRQNTSFDIDFSDIAFANDTLGVVVGDSGTLLLTFTGGISWNIQAFDSVMKDSLIKVAFLSDTGVIASGKYATRISGSLATNRWIAYNPRSLPNYKPGSYIPALWSTFENTYVIMDFDSINNITYS